MKLKKYAILPYFIQHVITFLLRPIFLFFLKVSVKGLEHLKSIDSSVVFAPNHQSELDPILITTFLPKKRNFFPLFYATREKKFYEDMGWKKIIYGGRLFRAVGGFPLFVGRNDYREALRHHTSILEDNHSVLIFAEGTRSKDNTFKKPKGGISYLAYATKKAVIPVLIKNTHAVTLKSFLLRRHTIEIIFHEPITHYELFQDKEYLSTDKESHEEKAQYIFNKMKM